MSTARMPHELIRDLVAERASQSDTDILAELERLPPLADEVDTVWDEHSHWWEVANLYVALGDIAAERKLRPAVRLLLERACNGDPGEMMRGLRHSCEAIFNPDWSALADICMEMCASTRQGTRVWAMHQLMILDDPRAKHVFERGLSDGNPEVRWAAGVGLERLQAS